jgi:hypothetical protein
MTQTDELKKDLTELTYPCYFIAYGPERSYRTTYRGEHGGCFGTGMIDNAEAAYRLVENGQYEGFYSEMTLIAISIEDGELKETQIR